MWQFHSLIRFCTDISHFRYFGVYQNHCVSTFKYFQQGKKKKKRNTTVHSWLFFLISWLLPLLVMHQPNEEMKWNLGKSVSLALKKILFRIHPFLPSQVPPRVYPSPVQHRHAAQMVFCLMHFQTSPRSLIPKTEGQQGLSSLSRAHRVCPSPSPAADQGNELGHHRGHPKLSWEGGKASQPCLKGNSINDMDSQTSERLKRTNQTFSLQLL